MVSKVSIGIGGKKSKFLDIIFVLLVAKYMLMDSKLMLAET